MSPFLLDLLCDPLTKESLRLEDEEIDDVGNIISGVLVSPSGTRYPIVAGIPRFTLLDSERQKTVQSFGDEWNHFNFIDFRENWLGHTVGNTFGGPEAFEDKVVVDAGAGSGSQMRWILEAGARHVVGIELSHAVDGVIRRNLEESGFTNYDIIQASIDAPPLKSGSINGIVICHNVIQHTESVERTAEALFEVVAPGGEFVFNCYPENSSGLLRGLRFHLIYRPLRKLLSSLSFRSLLVYSHVMAALRLLPGLGWILEKAGFCNRGEVVGGGSLRNRIRLSYRATALNTFDGFGSHAYQHLKKDSEIRALVRSLAPSAVLNEERYFARPQPIGCALRLRK